MEEVDGIILVSLRQIGVGIDANVTSLKQFNSDLFFLAVVSYLKVIQPDKKLPDSLPKEVKGDENKGRRRGIDCYWLITFMLFIASLSPALSH